MTGEAPSPEMLRLMRCLACLPHGLALVEFGSSSIVAGMFSCAGEVVDEVRTALADSGMRPQLVGEYERAAGRYASAPDEFCADCPCVAAGASCRCPLALIREAEKHPSGIELLQSAALETVAIDFGVHPFVVLGARSVLARRGLGPTEAGDEPAAP